MVGDLEAILETGSVAAVELAASELAKQGKATGQCANCAHPIIGAYCAVCGQPTNVHRRSLMELAHDFFSELASFDSRILRTVRALLFQPGELAIAFHEGRTQRYMPALRLYLFVSLIFFILLGATGIALVQLEVVATPVKVSRDAQGNYFIPNPAYDKSDPDTYFLGREIKIPAARATQKGGLFTFTTNTYFFRPLGSVHSNLTAAQRAQLSEPPPTMDVDTDALLAREEKASAGDKDAQRALEAARSRVRAAAAGAKGKGAALRNKITTGIQRIAADPAALNGPITTWLPRALFFLLPLYAILLALMHLRRRKQYYFVDHLVFSLNIHTFVFAALIGAAGLAQFVPGNAVAVALFAVITLYIFVAMKRFYKQGWSWTTVKFLTVSGIYTVFFLLPALAVVTSLGFFGGTLG
jgi:hypothetical protein